MIDEVTLFVRAGKGGDGIVAFHSEPYKPRGGPDGGDGGDGGSVILEASSRVRDLAWFADHPHQRAEDGRPGGGDRKRGATGEDRVLLVPDGTVVHDEDGLVADLVGEGTRVVVARGGGGGRGNASLAGSRNRLPRVAESGEPGEERTLRLELRVVADAGLVGLPNAGKSTLLACLTAARPKVAAYPFTTLTPNLGVTEGATRVLLADVPGLIEGAHEGKGLGDRFLRHVMRCRVLVFVVDVAAEDPETDLETVRQELRAYDPGLAERPWLVAATKADLVEDPWERARVLGPQDRVLVVSGETGEGVAALAERLEALVAEVAASAEERKAQVVLRPGRPRFLVREEGERRFRVVGRLVERWVAETDLEDPEQVASLQRRLKKEGVERRLAEVGARRGDEVLIADRAFEFIPDEEG